MTLQESLMNQDEITEEMDHLSLEQALLDFEVANARVLDLTHRLIELGGVNNGLRAEIEQLRLELSAVRSVHEQMKSSAAFRIADKVWTIRNALRR
jgi:hypothetical protein